MSVVIQSWSAGDLSLRAVSRGRHARLLDEVVWRNSKPGFGV